MAVIKTCIFDLDGVICDTAKYHYQAWRDLAASLGFDLTPMHDEHMKGVGRMESLELILGWAKITLPQDEKLRLCERKNNQFVDLIQTITPADILPGVETFIQSVKAQNIKIALGSASRNASTILEKLRIAHYFDAIVDGNTVSKAKPNPEVFLKGAEATNTPPANCVVFEDAISGIDAALNAGMYAVGIGNKSILQKAHLCISTFDGFTVKSLFEL